MAETTTDTDASDTGNISGQTVPLHERPEFIAWLTASCHTQDVPVTVTDPTVIGRVATLLGADRPARAAKPEAQTRHTGATRPISKLRAPGVPGAMTA
ncbi:hypothetical protein F0402_13300 [Mycolicibacter arupensis]|jgi:hypothetical protein|uniref:Uncharacterized protein n=1 Tax=Mycolicibacter arupensis TaxID=342002 RepID=A0A5C7XSC1_9MYCO|nr:hypothetical protein [Mycolicibacter arupensis]KAA1430551.1 hypothetical protein F0402_13300 [Mycolicibacter arupensis]TXI52298.1 MAG: hypothetical protein E6Q54_18685 [Mycolicibacter arupensis]